MIAKTVMTCCAAGAMLTACGQSLLRDDYQGRGWLEPDREPYRVQRDLYGNPIITDPPTQSTNRAPPKG